MTATVLALLPIAGAYLVGVRAVRRWPALRTTSFLAGLGVLAVALGPLDGPAAERLSAHMVQHMLLAFFAPPLVLAGAPLRLALGALPPGPRRRLRVALATRAVATLTAPAVALVVFSSVLVGSHVPVVYDAALASPPLHALEHALYFWSAMLLWIPALAVRPLPGAPSPLGRMLLLLFTMPAMAVVGVGLVLAHEVAYDTYAAHGNALADQQTAGRIMWLGGTPLMAAVLLAVGWSALLQEERRARARDEAEAVR